MAQSDYNIQLNSDFTSQEYSPPPPGSFTEITNTGSGGSVVQSINGQVGPTITFNGGSSGFTFNAASSTITLVSPLTTKGDLYTRNSTTGVALSVGAHANGEVLTLDSGEATGMKWATPATTGTVTHTGTLTANTLIIGNGGADITITTTGTGVLTALGVNVGTAGSFVVNGGALGSPSSAGTIPAFTLGGTVTGAANTISNVNLSAATGVSLSNANTVLSVNTTNTTGGLQYLSSGTQVAQLTISGGDMYFDYQGVLNFRSGFSGTQRVSISAAGVVTMASLAGVGTRHVVVDASGVMSAP